MQPWSCGQTDRETAFLCSAICVFSCLQFCLTIVYKITNFAPDFVYYARFQLGRFAACAQEAVDGDLWIVGDLILWLS